MTKKTKSFIFLNEQVTSQFCDLHGRHIITEQLRLIDNSNLRKLKTKGPSYRESRVLNYNKVFDNIKSAFDNCIQDLSKNSKL